MAFSISISGQPSDADGPGFEERNLERVRDFIDSLEGVEYAQVVGEHVGSVFIIGGPAIAEIDETPAERARKSTRRKKAG